MSKKVFVGDIGRESYIGLTPIQLFEKAVELSKLDEFSISTNNPQFLEAIEVLCGKENVKVFIKFGLEYTHVNFYQAYNYLGDVYDIINTLRVKVELLECTKRGSKELDAVIEKEIKEYNDKWSNVEGKEFLKEDFDDTLPF